MSQSPFYNIEELSDLGLRSIGDSVLISRKASIHGASRISIGSFSRIDDFCILSAGDGGISIGRNVHIAVMSTLIGKGSINIKDFCNLSSRVSVYSSSDDYSGEYMTNPTIPDLFTNVDNRDVYIEKHTIIGTGSIILPGVTIFEGVAVGAMSLVKKDLSSYGIYAGVPLKRIRDRSKRFQELEKEYLKYRKSK